MKSIAILSTALILAITTFTTIRGLFDLDTDRGYPSVRAEFTEVALPEMESITNSSHKKTVFFQTLLPIIDSANNHTLRIRKKLKELRGSKISPESQRWLNDLSDYYKIEYKYQDNDFWEQLSARIDIIPPSLALAQAANESAWGTSRFSIKANNLYGQWCFDEGCGLVPKNRNLGSTHEVRRFSTINDSVLSYMRNINTHPAYNNIRNIRSGLRNKNKPITGIELAKGLANYSERGEEYIKEISAMIRFNQLEQYDMKASND